jgi:hypothetical protein
VPQELFLTWLPSLVKEWRESVISGPQLLTRLLAYGDTIPTPWDALCAGVAPVRCYLENAADWLPVIRAARNQARGEEDLAAKAFSQECASVRTRSSLHSMQEKRVFYEGMQHLHRLIINLEHGCATRTERIFV